MAGNSKKDLLAMPETVVNTFGYALGLAQNGLSYPDAKTLTQFKSAVVEVLEDHDTDTIGRSIRHGSRVQSMCCIASRRNLRGKASCPSATGKRLQRV